MSQEEAVERLFALAKHMEVVREALADPRASTMYRLNQVAWLGELACQHADVIRVALGAPRPAEGTS